MAAQSAKSAVARAILDGACFARRGYARGPLDALASDHLIEGDCRAPPRFWNRHRNRSRWRWPRAGLAAETPACSMVCAISRKTRWDFAGDTEWAYGASWSHETSQTSSSPTTARASRRAVLARAGRNPIPPRGALTRETRARLAAASTGTWPVHRHIAGSNGPAGLRRSSTPAVRHGRASHGEVAVQQFEQGSIQGRKQPIEGGSVCRPGDRNPRAARRFLSMGNGTNRRNSILGLIRRATGRPVLADR